MKLSISGPYSSPSQTSTRRRSACSASVPMCLGRSSAASCSNATTKIQASVAATGCRSSSDCSPHLRKTWGTDAAICDCEFVVQRVGAAVKVAVNSGTSRSTGCFVHVVHLWLQAVRLAEYELHQRMLALGSRTLPTIPLAPPAIPMTGTLWHSCKTRNRLYAQSLQRAISYNVACVKLRRPRQQRA